jgi:hypothetical protein
VARIGFERPRARARVRGLRAQRVGAVGGEGHFHAFVGEPARERLRIERRVCSPGAGESETPTCGGDGGRRGRLHRRGLRPRVAAGATGAVSSRLHAARASRARAGNRNVADLRIE